MLRFFQLASTRFLRYLFVLSAIGFLALPTASADEWETSIAVWVEQDAPRFVPDQPEPPDDNLFTINTSGSAGGAKSSAVWLRIDVPAQPLHSPDRVLVVGPAYLDHAVLFRSSGKSPELDQAIASGDALPFSAKNYPHRMHVFPLGTEAGRYYLRTSTDGVLRVDWSVQDEADFLRNDREVTLGYAVLLGFLGAMILFNIGVMAGIGDRTYLYYVSYHVSAGLVIASLAGFTAQHLFPDASNSSNRSIPIALTLMCLSGSLFVYSFIDLPSHLPKLARQMRLAIGAIALLGIPGLLLPYYHGAIYTYLGCAVALGAIGHMLFASLRIGVLTAKFVALTFVLTIFPGSVGAFLYQYGVLAHNIFLAHVLEITTAVETLLLSLFMAYRIKVSEREKLSAQAETLELQREFNRRMLAKQEEDRSRIARELHDSVGPNLSALNIHLQSVNDPSADSKPMMSSEDALTLLRQSISEVRELSHSLHPSRLDRLSLASAIEAYCRQFTIEGKLGFRTELDVQESEITESKKIHLYRIAQEAIHNVVGHAQATLCYLSLTRIGHQIVFTIRDNGCGFSPEEANSKGLGMTSMSDRADIIDASFEVESTPGEGTTVKLRFDAAAL